MTSGIGAPPRILVLDRSPELADRVREAVAVLEPVPEVVALMGLTAAAPAALSGGASVLLAGPTMFAPTGLQGLAALHRKAPSAGVVLVVDRPSESNLREIVQVGADDVLPVGVSRDELCLSLERVLTLVQHRSGSLDEPAAPTPEGQVITVASPTEGCGKTFLAANTALFLARDAGAKVVLVDLDLQFGEVRTSLRARADFSIMDALQSEAEGHDLEVVLPDLMFRHPSGFSILAAPRDPEDADSIGPGDIARVIAALRARADYVVVDAPSGLAEHLLPVLDVTRHLLAVATPDRPSVHNLAVFLTTLERLGVGEEITIMLNKAEDDSDLGEAASRLPQSLTAVLPYDREVARSINLGVPLLEGAPSSPVAQELRAVLGRLFGTATGAAADATPARSRNRPRVFGGRRQRHLDTTTVLPAGPATGAETDEQPVADLHVEELPPFLTESEPFLYAGTAPRSADRLRRHRRRTSGDGHRLRSTRPGRPPSTRRAPNVPGRRRTVPRRAQRSRAPPRRRANARH